MKKIFFLIALLVVIAAPVAPVAAKPKPVVTDVYSMIAEVNALRVANGLPAYTISPILMSIAQQHAEFMAINGMSHIGYGGTRPYQRALNAGYPLAGDLSLGGFISENITGGMNKSVQEAVLSWQGDAPHLHTMLSGDLQEIGAGVAYVGEQVYYVIDCARPTGSGQPQNTRVPGQTQVVFGPPLASTVIPSTPNADGRLVHVVGPGETLWLIAITYGVKIAEIRALNYMTEAEAIYPGEKLLIRKDVVVTPLAAPSDTPGVETTLTSVPTQQVDALTPTAQGNALQETPASDGTSQSGNWTLTPSLPTQVMPSATIVGAPAPAASSDLNIIVLGVIVLAALVLAGVLARAGRQAR